MTEDYHRESPNRRTNLKRYALSYAAKGIPVFPCKLDKSPLTPHGFYDATTDPEQVSEWWTKHPKASIATPTGMASGLVVPDLDEETHEALKLWHRLPDTLTSKTGRASGKGRHRFYSVDRPVASGKLAGGAIDLKADGGYVILPPSGHESGNCYEWLHRLPVAPLPEELLSAPEAEETGSSDHRHRGPRRYTDDGGPIPEGQRDDALISIAGLLRAQGLEEGEILDELHAINQERCQPPLKAAQVRVKARQAGKWPKGNLRRRDEGSRLPLDRVRVEWWTSPWPNKSDRDISHVLINEGLEHGRLLKCGGVDVSIGYRELAVKAAVSLRTVRKGVKRLIEDGWLRKGQKGSGTQCGSLILLPRAGVPHYDHRGFSSIEDVASVVHPRTPRLRHSATLPVMRKGRRVDTITILRLGKTDGAIIDVLLAHGLSAEQEDLAATLHIKRVRDMMRRNIQRMTERGIVTVQGTTIGLVDDWMEALETERSVTGEKFAEAYWTKRYKEQQEAYRGKHKVKAHRFTMAEMWDRLPRPTSELQRMPEPHPDLVTLFRLWSESRPLMLREHPSWLAGTVWAYEWVNFQPTRLDVEAALYEVGHYRKGAA